jgi:hypothetical protein
MGGDEQDRCGHPGCKHRQRDGGRKPVVAVHHGSRDQGTDGLQDQTQPFDGMDLGSTDQDALTTRQRAVAAA